MKVNAAGDSAEPTTVREALSRFSFVCLLSRAMDVYEPEDNDPQDHNMCNLICIALDTRLAAGA